MDFKIEYTWDGFPVKHEPVFVRLNPGDGGVVMEVSAPFFNDPPAPLGEPGKPFNELWDYEVVEAFFLNDITEQYLEVELCPHGQHLVLLLSGRRNVWKQELALSFRVSREETKWEGKAYLPWSYFPPKVTKFNSFAIHGSKDKRNYEALYPVPQHELQQGQKPDFWTIEFTAWENLPVLHRLVSLKFKSGIQGLLMEVNAFFDDLPTPPEYADQPRDGPWEYEDWGLDELMKPFIQYSMKKLRSDKCDLKPLPCVF
uniref:CD033 protein n=1 Tax=Felis catus TaxID=9685 RepID=A0ABI7XA81_FELCA